MPRQLKPVPQGGQAVGNKRGLPVLGADKRKPFAKPSVQWQQSIAEVLDCAAYSQANQHLHLYTFKLQLYWHCLSTMQTLPLLLTVRHTLRARIPIWCAWCRFQKVLAT